MFAFEGPDLGHHLEDNFCLFRGTEIPFLALGWPLQRKQKDWEIEFTIHAIIHCFV